jgi:hypothetical protein
MDNSKSRDEKFSEGYSLRVTEINSAILILIESDLYELDLSQYNIFKRMYRLAIFNKDRQAESLDYIRDNCPCINNHVECFNY